MPRRTRETAPHDVLLTALAAAAIVAGLAVVYMHSRVTAEEARVAAAEVRLDEEADLAAQYRSIMPRQPVISKDITDAHSSEFIQQALRSNGVSPGNIQYGDPQEQAGRFARVEITIEVKSAMLGSLLEFMREVAAERPQLSLLSAEIERDTTADRWSGRLTYGALIPARPRS